MTHKLYKTIAIFLILFLYTCASTSIKDAEKKIQEKEAKEKKEEHKAHKEKEIEREKAILKQYTNVKKEKYADLLVDIKLYTTNGAYFQKKYHKYLIGIAGDITENKKMKIQEGSIGFYYDKKSHDKSRLYLGLDINTGNIQSSDYVRVASNLIESKVTKVISTINACKTIFDEDEIVGMVIGFKWKSQGYGEQVNMWIRERDVILFENDRLTFDELIQRSTVTNTSGKIIRLPQ